MRAAAIALLSHWRRRPGQGLTLVLGLALATALWVAVQAINAEARAAYARAADQIGTGRYESLTAETGRIPVATYVRLRRAGWPVTPLLEGRFRVADGTVSLIGADLLSYPARPEPQPGIDGPEPAQLFGRPGIVFGRPDTLARLGAAEGLPAPLPTDELPPDLLLTDISTAARLLDRPDTVTRLLLIAPPGADLPPLADIAPGLQRHPPRTGLDAAQLTDSFHLNLTAFGLLCFAVGLFIVHGAAGLAFEQRRAMFRTLRALGLPLRRLALLLLAELVALGLLAGILGVILGWVVAALLLPDVAATLRGLYGAPAEGGLHLRPGWIISGLAMALAGVLLAGAQGLLRLRALPLLAAGSQSAWTLAETRRHRWMAIAGGALILAGLAAAMVDGLLAGFALLAGLMLGSALLLPPLLAAALRRIAARTRDPVMQWVWADLRAQLPGLSLALMALLLAMATNIGVGTMVSGFRLTFTGWLDQRLPAELYLTAPSETEAAAITEWLATRADAVLPTASVRTGAGTQEIWVHGITPHATYRDNWPVLRALPDGWDRLADGSGAMINEQFARRGGIALGDMLMLDGNDALQVVGIYSDYGNPTGQAMVSLETLQSIMGPLPVMQALVRVAPGNAATLAAELRGAFALRREALRPQAAIKSAALAVFDKTFVITAALNLLTLGVAGFAIFTSLLTLWLMRLPQVAPVWALGLSRARLARLELIRSLALTAMTALLALPLGMVLAWVLMVVINAEAFGWRLPFAVFPMDWVRLGALALLAGALAAALPARRLHRLPPAELLKVFASER
ncbi:FtsX-like permease family protein [Pukyongiella litopenaei]